MQKVINCSCGYIVRAENDEKLVAKAQEHAKQVHQMDLTREQALAMARPVTGTKNMTINTPVNSVGQAICRKVTSGLNSHMR